MHISRCKSVGVLDVLLSGVNMFASAAGSRYLDPDGTFPNHSPNPEDKEAMRAGCEAVQESSSDLGIVVDTVSQHILHLELREYLIC